MTIYEISFSPTGGTKKAADILMSAFTGNKKEISLIPAADDYSKYVFEKDDICVFAVPSFGGRVPVTAVDRIIQMKGNGARAVVICVYGNRAYDDTLLELKNTLKEAGFIPVAAAAAIAEHSIMRQFAEGRPDDADTVILNKYSEMIWQKVNTMDLNEVTVPGKEPYREYKGIPFKPSADKKCSGCGLCINECPTAAIIPGRPVKTDKDKCISCMRCIKICPQDARELNQLILGVAAKKMAPVFAERKEPEIFID